MALPPGHLAEHPLPPGILGALGLSGYQLLADLGGVGAGRLGDQAFLLVAPDPDPRLPDAGTQIALHHTRLRNEADAAAYVALAAQLGYLRLAGYRLALERHGLRSSVALVNPATGGIAATIPDRVSGGLLGGRRGGGSPAALVARLRELSPAGPAPDLQNPELMRQTLLALALADDSIGGAEAAEVADRALALTRGDGALDPPAAIEAARRSG